MFTLKLYKSDRQVPTPNLPQRIIEAEEFTLYAYNEHAIQVTAHGYAGDGTGVWYVGDPNTDPSDGGPMPHGEDWFDRMIIENRFGKTTEYFSPAPVGPPTMARKTY